MSERALPLASLVPPELRELLRARALVLHRPVFGRRLGRHRSARAGVGLDFRDHRAYVPGDDPRRLDWRAVARRERLVLRQTEAEDELSVVFATDLGGSMDYGEGDQHKLSFARALVGALAWLASRQGDPVGLATGSGGQVDDSLVRPSSSPERLDGFAARLGDTSPGGACPWLSLLEAVTPRLPRRSVFIAVSDFLDPSGEGDDQDGETDRALIGALASIRSRGHDVVLLQTLHRDELEFPWSDRTTVRFADLFGLRKPNEGAAAAMREGYLAALRAHQQRLRERCDREGLILHTVHTDTDRVEAFLGLMERFEGVVPQGGAA
ncbi:MAG: DUF58 domain-containing protein [Nannocystaceae bacterium]|nr:DUF58 domain-containing protein [bacterium]